MMPKLALSFKLSLVEPLLLSPLLVYSVVEPTYSINSCWWSHLCQRIVLYTVGRHIYSVKYQQHVKRKQLQLLAEQLLLAPFLYKSFFTSRLLFSINSCCMVETLYLAPFQYKSFFHVMPTFILQHQQLLVEPLLLAVAEAGATAAVVGEMGAEVEAEATGAAAAAAIQLCGHHQAPICQWFTTFPSIVRRVCGETGLKACGHRRDVL